MNAPMNAPLSIWTAASHRSGSTRTKIEMPADVQRLFYGKGEIA
jgi:hypothetical protein